MFVNNNNNNYNYIVTIPILYWSAELFLAYLPMIVGIPLNNPLI